MPQGKGSWAKIELNTFTQHCQTCLYLLRSELSINCPCYLNPLQLSPPASASQHAPSQTLDAPTRHFHPRKALQPPNTPRPPKIVPCPALGAIASPSVPVLRYRHENVRGRRASTLRPIRRYGVRSRHGKLRRDFRSGHSHRTWRSSSCSSNAVDRR